MTEKKYGGIIENWYELKYPYNIIEGDLYNDPQQRWEEGTFIHTSSIVKLDEDLGKVETLNTIYDLGVKSIQQQASRSKFEAQLKEMLTVND